MVHIEKQISVLEDKSRDYKWRRVPKGVSLEKTRVDGVPLELMEEC